MAEGKKSFILYTDIIHTVSKLPDVKAGKLFKTILEYVNDLNPEVNDTVVDLVFEPIKQQLKRDLKRYESYIKKQQANGKKGGRPPKDEQETQNNPNNPSLILETQANPSQPKKADSDSDSVNDNDSVSVIEEAAPKQNLDVHATYETVKRATVDDVLFIEQGAMAAGGDKEQFKKFCQKKLDKMQAAGILTRYKISGIRGFMIEDFEKLPVPEKKNSFTTGPKIKNLT